MPRPNWGREVTPIETLLKKLESKPCACGKRNRGDQQEAVGECRVETMSEFDSDDFVRYSCQFRCLVCKDIHKAALLIPSELAAKARKK